MAKIKIMALGGLGENGKNMYLVEVNEQIFILDAGLKYPEIDMYGVDAVVPNIDYLIANKNRIEGLFISHGHEDNIGAIPYLLKNIPMGIYGTHFTISLIEGLLVQNKMNIKNYKLFRINDTKVLKFGEVIVSFYNNTHSIPEAVGIAIKTEDGMIVYSTDFNFGMQFNEKYDTSFEKMTDISKNSVLAILGESVGLSSINRVPNDILLEHRYNNILNNTKNRIIVAAFSTDLNRIQKIIDLSLLKNKKIAFIGRKAQNSIDVAITNHYLKFPEGSLIELKAPEDKTKNELDDLVIIVVGTRNEPYTTLVKMASGDAKGIKINKDDQVVLMCPPIPGTEKYTTDAINELSKYGVNLTIFDKTVLRSNHASQDDLKLLYAIMKPKYIIPIKGEYRHMYEHRLLINTLGYNKEACILLDNGEVVTFINREKQQTIEKVVVGDVFVDGTLTGDVNEEVIKDRENLATEGAIIVSINYDLRCRTIKGKPIVIFEGVVVGAKEEELRSSIIATSNKLVISALTKKKLDLESLKTGLEEEITKAVSRIIKKRPVVIINLLDQNNTMKGSNK